ncbi:unnamed protein product [Ranitomeya imitator]|uniref:Uncharacterized protein n=1 Tax=Ranitomeya imitator TaxID=111125 RepID=A0ABN9LP94_9NEOB|nr:unnamed protein product [Ranitomeya imitator]
MRRKVGVEGEEGRARIVVSQATVAPQVSAQEGICQRDRSSGILTKYLVVFHAGGNDLGKLKILDLLAIMRSDIVSLRHDDLEAAARTGKCSDGGSNEASRPVQGNDPAMEGDVQEVNRSRLLDRLRQAGDRVGAGVGGSFLVQEVMEEEWQAMHRVPALWRKASLSQDPEELVTLEEIKQELLLEEQAMVEEIESIVQFESDCLDSVVGLSRNEVVCPVCNRNYLTITSCFVMCRCGVYINCKV